MPKPKQQKPNFDIGDLLEFLNQPKVKAATNLSQGKLTSQDVMGVLGNNQSKAAPYSGFVADAYNNKVKTDYETAKFFADWFLPVSEGQRLVQGKSEPMDPLWAAMGIFPYGKVGKKLKSIKAPAKMILDAIGGGSKMGRNMTNQQFSGSTDYTYSPLELLLMQLQGG
ncbi:hypothetical protein UFOVP1549_17 [uncultured Caudovirales phage]|uniref:Uncharacterized protein n=1 Tax=uncultured Caudovirales phage TaxID=2100421 RepID=A0A6J5LNC1_9CAUD|nr:hypothetical protein UFOVP303_16 [uncultured Caudovirales phage]CAB5228501.1 hypothetical protein UFOVP1549_17 [uncultured Caudovirales phage]